jgi:predicted transcriptional regulator
VRTFDEAARVLGELELLVMDLRVMDALWDEHPQSVRAVQGRLARPKLAYTTVMTTLDRLYKKGLLARDKVGIAFVYRPAIDRDEYQRRVVEAALSPLLEQAAGTVLAAFVDVAADVSVENLDRLQKLIAARRRRR